MKYYVHYYCGQLLGVETGTNAITGPRDLTSQYNFSKATKMGNKMFFFVSYIFANIRPVSVCTIIIFLITIEIFFPLNQDARKLAG